jgi:GT2 family glycosyltransferase
MALIAMAVYSTEENKKDECLVRTLESLFKTVDFNRHRLILSVNGYTSTTEAILITYSHMIQEIIWNGENLGTAEAINKAWRKRLPNENAIKMDDDVVIHSSGWVDEMEEAIRRDSNIGQCGLKRKDCLESPSSDGFFKSQLIMLPHAPGQTWILAEQATHIMGTCQMYSSALLDKIGYLYQIGVYGFDDVFASHRSKLAGFKNVFLPHINIDHIDKGDTPFQKWKENQANGVWQSYINTIKEYDSGTKSIYYNPYE